MTYGLTSSPTVRSVGAGNEARFMGRTGEFPKSNQPTRSNIYHVIREPLASEFFT